MSIDFEPDETQAAVSDALSALCRQHCPESVARADPGQFPSELWSALAQFGLFTLGAPEGMGGMVEVAAAGEVLGAAVAPGPLAAAFFAVHSLPVEDRGAVAAGEAVAVLVAPPLVPWPDRATILLETDGEETWRVEMSGVVEPLRTLGGEPWGRAATRRMEKLGPAGRAGAIHDVFLAAYLAAAARKLLKDAAEYVSHRRQFGKTLSQFQAVSHPLAESAIRARAAATLARIAAYELDVQAPEAQANAAAARISAENAALQAVNVCHQSYGAMGITADGPVFYISRRIRQLANQQVGMWPRLRVIEGAYLDEPLPELRVALR